MGDLEKSGKENFDVTVKTIAESAKSAPGKVIGIVILVLVVINTFWNLWENGNKISAELQTLKTDLTALVTRQTELEKNTAGAADLEDLKTDIELAKETVKVDIASIAKAGESFEAKLNSVIQAEESKLEVLLKEAENQKAYIENLKKLLAGESGR